MDDQGAVFLAEEIEPIFFGVMEKHLAGQYYVESSVDAWVNAICEDTIAALAAHEKPFKYVVHCVIMQNTGAGMHSALAELCDGTVDGTVLSRWPAEKDKDKTNILTVLTAFGIAY